MHILFFGDSITDAGRSRPDGESLGGGYAAIVANALRERHPRTAFTFTNMGTSGDRTKDLLARIRQDVVRRHPDLVVLMIGINDVWRRYDANDPTTPATFAANFEDILDILRKDAKAKVVLMEPFLLAVPDKPFREDLDPKIALVRAIAEKHRIPLVRLDALLAARKATAAAYAGDGIHPTPAGSEFIAAACLQAIESIL